MRIDANNTINAVSDSNQPSSLNTTLTNMINRLESGFCDTSIPVSQIVGQVSSMIGLIGTCDSIPLSIQNDIHQLQQACANSDLSSIESGIRCLGNDLASTTLTSSPASYFAFLNQQINQLLAGCQDLDALSMSQISQFSGMSNFLDQIPEISSFDASASTQWSTGFGVIAMDLRSIVSAAPSQTSTIKSIAQTDISGIFKHLSLLNWYAPPHS